MNLEKLEQIIFKPSSSFMRKKGEEIFRNGLVSNIRGKKIDNIYHVYGDIKEINKEIKTHMKINMHNNTLVGVSCSCDNFREISINKSMFMCEHLNAAAYKFLDSLYRKKFRGNEKLNKLSSDPKEEIKLSFDIKIECKKRIEEDNYELEFRIGIKNKILITNLKNFINEVDNGKFLTFNSKYFQNDKESSISQQDMKIVDFIREHVYKNKEALDLSRKIIIKPVKLKEFLLCVGERRILFKYNGIEYKADVLTRDLPLSFTLKDNEKNLILTTHKKLPIPLDNDKEVYFFDGKIYIPTENQVKKYRILHNKFLKEEKIKYKKNLENYNAAISMLNSISKDVIVSESTKRFGTDTLNLEFEMYKENNNIYCNTKVIYYNKKINILEGSERELIRDFSKEQKILMKLESYNFIKRTSRFMFIGREEELFDILKNSKNSISSLGKVILGKGLEEIKIYKSSAIEINISQDNEDLYFSYNIGNIEREEFRNVFESYKNKDRFYKIHGKGFIDFEDEGIKSFLKLIEVLDINKVIDEELIKIDKNKIFYLATIIKNGNFKLGDGIDILKNIESKLISINSKEIDIPQKLKAVLRGYQVKGYKWFKTISELGFGGVLADEMGLGKTVQTISLLASEEGKKSIIITPTSLIYNWKNEIEKFAPSLKFMIYHKDNKIVEKIQDYDLILTTYGTLKNNINKFKNIEFDYCIIDEAQNIKNPAAKNTIAVKEINSNRRFALTGTPIENNLTELWSIFDFIMPGYLYSKENFEKKFVFNDDIESLILLVKPFILRRTKKEVIDDLPDKIEKKLLIPMTIAQKSAYSSYIKEVRRKMKEGNDRIQIFSYLTRLRQICLDPSLIFSEYEGGSGKLKVALDLVEEQIACGGKVLLFSQFTSVLNKIGNSLIEKGIEFLYLDGATEPKERIKLVNDFNESKKVKVFLISLKAGGTGLNLTSANLVIHFDPWWNPAVENQATDRAHRIGQKNIVEVIKLIAKGTIEEKIVLLQEHKKQLIDSIITDDLKNSDNVNKLTREELIEIISRD